MTCPKFTAEGKQCTLPVNHPNFCSHDPTAKPVMTKAGIEAQHLVDAVQRGKIILARNPECKKCKGRAYHELPDTAFEETPKGTRERVVEHSVCSGCGGYLYTIGQKRTAYAVKSNRPGSTAWAIRAAEIDAAKPKEAEKLPPKTISGIARETPELTAARLAEHERRHPSKRAAKPVRRDYMAEAAKQAAKDVDAMLRWNGF